MAWCPLVYLKVQERLLGESGEAWKRWSSGHSFFPLNQRIHFPTADSAFNGRTSFKQPIEKFIRRVTCLN